MAVLELTDRDVKLIQITAAYCASKDIDISRVFFHGRDDKGYLLEVEATDRRYIQLRINLEEQTLEEDLLSGEYVLSYDFEETKEGIRLKVPGAV